jgi:hypothetical protein
MGGALNGHAVVPAGIAYELGMVRNQAGQAVCVLKLSTAGGDCVSQLLFMPADFERFAAQCLELARTAGRQLVIPPPGAVSR